MPFAPKRLCSVPRCGFYAEFRGKCEAHKVKADSQRREDRKEDRRFYDSSAWRGTDGIRIKKLTQYPFCERLLEDGKPCNKIAKHVDHIKSIAEGGSKTAFENLMSLCHSCHSIKTLSDGSFGRSNKSKS